MPKVTVDGQEIEVPAGATVLQACELAGKEIPRVAALLATKPFSEDETALFGQLGETMNGCIPVEHGTKLGFGRLDLRARLGSVAYELAAAANLEAAQ